MFVCLCRTSTGVGLAPKWITGCGRGSCLTFVYAKVVKVEARLVVLAARSRIAFIHKVWLFCLYRYFEVKCGRLVFSTCTTPDVKQFVVSGCHPCFVRVGLVSALVLPALSCRVRLVSSRCSLFRIYTHSPLSCSPVAL